MGKHQFFSSRNYLLFFDKDGEGIFFNFIKFKKVEAKGFSAKLKEV